MQFSLPDHDRLCVNATGDEAQALRLFLDHCHAGEFIPYQSCEPDERYPSLRPVAVTVFMGPYAKPFAFRADDDDTDGAVVLAGLQRRLARGSVRLHSTVKTDSESFTATFEVLASK